MSAVAARAISWTESGRVPDAIIRQGIRRLLEAKRAQVAAGDVARAAELEDAFVAEMRRSPVALVPDLANEQHYEVPAAFFREVLGARRKYSCAYWTADTQTLDAAEEAALALAVRRAGIVDGQRVLDLGCGWGSMALWIAENYPACTVTAVSNSRSQREAILADAEARGLGNLEVVTADMNDFEADGRFDRIVSIEMFEHMRNYAELFTRIRRWLGDDGRFFLHIFTHRTTPYAFVDRGPSDWMSRHFFSGGIMPSATLPLRFADDLLVERRWALNGHHYARTCRAWLHNMDARRERVASILADTYGTGNVEQWRMRWRIFFMACEELFRYGGGNEWFVSHYRLRPADGGQ